MALPLLGEEFGSKHNKSNKVFLSNEIFGPKNELPPRIFFFSEKKTVFSFLELAKMRFAFHLYFVRFYLRCPSFLRLQNSNTIRFTPLSLKFGLDRLSATFLLVWETPDFLRDEWFESSVILREIMQQEMFAAFG